MNPLKSLFAGIAKPQGERIANGLTNVIRCETRDQRRAAKKDIRKRLSTLILDDLRKGKPMYQIAHDLEQSLKRE